VREDMRAALAESTLPSLPEFETERRAEGRAAQPGEQSERIVVGVGDAAGDGGEQGKTG
jgi:hypothetical protein